MPKARKMLSDWEASYIQSLRKLVETQSKAILAIWDYAEWVMLPRAEPGENRLEMLTMTHGGRDILVEKANIDY